MYSPTGVYVGRHFYEYATRKWMFSLRNLQVVSMDRKTFESWKAAVGLAADGKAVWLDKILTAAGYIRSFDRLAARQVARIFGVTPMAVGLWTTRTGCPRVDGKYSLSAIVDWKVARAKEEVMADLRRRGLSDDDLLENMGGTSQWLEAYRKEKTIEARRKNEIEAGRLIDAAEAEREWMEIGRIFREECEMLERVHGPEIGKDIRAMIERASNAWCKKRQEHYDGGN